jgi:hypothetical protein
MRHPFVKRSRPCRYHSIAAARRISRLRSSSEPPKNSARSSGTYSAMVFIRWLPPKFVDFPHCSPYLTGCRPGPATSSLGESTLVSGPVGPAGRRRLGSSSPPDGTDPCRGPTVGVRPVGPGDDCLTPSVRRSGFASSLDRPDLGTGRRPSRGPGRRVGHSERSGPYASPTRDRESPPNGHRCREAPSVRSPASPVAEPLASSARAAGARDPDENRGSADGAHRRIRADRRTDPGTRRSLGERNRDVANIGSCPSRREA